MTRKVKPPYPPQGFLKVHVNVTLSERFYATDTCPGGALPGRVSPLRGGMLRGKNRPSA
jgi:hypothetical protein